MYTIIFREIATNEYEEAVAWYKEHSTIAAKRFAVYVDKKIASITANPYQYKNIYKKFHEVSVSVYPYTIVYLIKERSQEVVIVSIYHQKRHPKKKYRS